MQERPVAGDFLEVDPTTLNFSVDSTRANITIKNHHTQPLAFKVKTTAPRRYCVRPTFGILQPESSEEVQVLLNTKEGDSNDDKNKDKFQVLSLLLTPEQAKSGDEVKNLWANATENSISKKRIKCHFELLSPTTTPTTIPQSPTFAPTIRTQDNLSSFDLEPMSPMNSTSSSTTPTKMQEITRDQSTTKSVNFSLPYLSKEPSALASELANLREEYNKTLYKINAMATERDQLKRETERLKDILTKEREENLRQRKVISSNTTSSPSSITKPQNSTVKTNQTQFLENRIVQFIIVALLFFLLGKWL